MHSIKKATPITNAVNNPKFLNLVALSFKFAPILMLINGCIVWLIPLNKATAIIPVLEIIL